MSVCVYHLFFSSVTRLSDISLLSSTTKFRTSFLLSPLSPLLTPLSEQLIFSLAGASCPWQKIGAPSSTVFPVLF